MYLKLKGTKGYMAPLNIYYVSHYQDKYENKATKKDYLLETKKNLKDAKYAYLTTNETDLLHG